MLAAQGRRLHANDESNSPITSSPPQPQSTSLADNIRALREAGPSRTNTPPSRVDQLGGKRKPAPSPLQQTSTHGTGGGLPQSPRSIYYGSTINQDGQPRSPREKLEALLATEYTENPSELRSRSSPLDVRLQDKSPSAANKGPSYAALRNVSAPVVRSVDISPPSSPIEPMAASDASRAEVRPVQQRNTSIDSAMSAASSNASQSYRSNTSHSYKSSTDTNPSQPPDMNAFIASSGSPEAALLALWKEKQSAASHNAQLWRLVEKQRAMILGLNKDLERALKDKERYRKKLKEQLAQVPPVPAPTKHEQIVEREQNESPALSERQDQYSVRSNSAQGLLSESPKTQTALPHKPLPAPAQAAQASAITYTALQGITNDGIRAPGSAKNSTSSGGSPAEYPKSFTEAAASPELFLPSTTTKTHYGNPPESSRMQSPETFLIADDDHVSPKSSLEVPSHSTPEKQQGHPTLTFTQATPQMDTGAFPSPGKLPGSQQTRKGPPAPLDLSADSNRTSSHLHQTAAGEHSDSDYDDILEDGDLPVFERGRRKTREDDDRARGVLASQDEEARSQSKKKKSKSKSKTPKEESAPVEEQIIPPPPPVESPPTRTVIAHSPPTGLPSSPRLADNAGSLAAMLSPTKSETSTATYRSGSASGPLSPGLPMSPRPHDRPPGSPLPRLPVASPPMSPRSAMGSPLSPREPKKPIPLPPTSPLAFASPHLARAEVYHQQQAPQIQVQQPQSLAGLLKPPTANESPVEHPQSAGSDPSPTDQVYTGLVSDHYPGLLLPPNALPSIDVKVSSSRMRPSRLSYMAPRPNEEDPVFHLAIYAHSNGQQLWRVEKTIGSLAALDHQVKSLCAFSGKLPDRKVFSGHAPATIDARRAALNSYFDNLLDTEMGEKSAMIICGYLSTDVIGADADQIKQVSDAASAISGTSASTGKAVKEGYLTKRGKNFGGWKARYFVLEDRELRYYDSPGGPHLGTIKLQNAQIGKQSQQPSNTSPSRKGDDEENQYRHAFLVLEPKKKDSSSLVRHVLCAESDEERDAWVEALLQYVGAHDEHKSEHAKGKEPSSATSHDFPKDVQDAPRNALDDEGLKAFSYGSAVAGEAPKRGPPIKYDGGPSSPTLGSFNDQHQYHQLPTISGPKNGAIIQDAEMWGNKALAVPSVKEKKRSIFAFRGRSSSDLDIHKANNSHSPSDRAPSARVVFGIPLAEAVECSQPIGVEAALPAVVYRCVEYLRAKGAVREEGIFRLSGSNIVIKALRERFNTEGDVKLLDGQYYDIHAVASLLKLYLRELPVSILTRELHLDFLKVLEIDEKEKKIQAFNVLVHKLPQVNYELIQTLAEFLIDIVDNADVNKMTVRNVGIVFAPTLNIPAPLISMFLTDHDDIFDSVLDETNSPVMREIESPEPQMTPESIRSPRRQMFSDLPTPAYNQTQFKPAPLFAQQQQSHAPSQHQQEAAYDTGFTPLQPSYNQSVYQQNPRQSDAFGSLNGALHPESQSGPMSRAKKRESGMLLVNMGLGSKSSMQRLREIGNHQDSLREQQDEGQGYETRF